MSSTDEFKRTRKDHAAAIEAASLAIAEMSQKKLDRQRSKTTMSIITDPAWSLSVSSSPISASMSMAGAAAAAAAPVLPSAPIEVHESIKQHLSPVAGAGLDLKIDLDLDFKIDSSLDQLDQLGPLPTKSAPLSVASSYQSIRESLGNTGSRKIYSSPGRHRPSLTLPDQSSAPRQVSKHQKSLSESTVRLADLSPRSLSYLTSFPTHLPNTITRLFLDDNDIVSIPSNAIAELTELRVLSLSSNHLTSLPSGIRRLRKLERICLRHNMIETLPDEFSELCNLRICDLGENKLTRIPPKLFLGMEHLHTLVLANNSLRQLPQSIGYLAGSLRVLYLQGNPFAYPFQYLVEPVIRSLPSSLPLPADIVGSQADSHGYLLRLLGFLRDEFDLHPELVGESTKDRPVSMASVASSNVQSFTPLPHPIPLRVTDKRSRIVAEIVATEKTYVDELVALLELYYRPLEQGDGMTVYDMEAIFSPVFMDILVHHRDFVLPNLRHLASIEGQHLGAFFSTIAPFLLEKYTIYMNNFDLSLAHFKLLETAGSLSMISLSSFSFSSLMSGGNGSSTSASSVVSSASALAAGAASMVDYVGLNSIAGNAAVSAVSSMVASMSNSNPPVSPAVTAKRSTGRKFIAHLKAAKLDPRHTQLNLNSYLVLPIQRLPRYKMLLESLLSVTSQEHPDYDDLTKAVADIKHVVEQCNENKREWERQQLEKDRIQDIRSRIKIRESSLGSTYLTRPITSSMQRRLILCSDSVEMRVVKYVEPLLTEHSLQLQRGIDPSLACHGKASKARSTVYTTTREYRFNVSKDEATSRGAREIEAGGATSFFGVPCTAGKLCTLFLFSDALCWCTNPQDNDPQGEVEL
eukprot:jgi/Hompol1/4038/HPOL_003460-RA